MIFDEPGQASTTRAPSTHWSLSGDLWFKRRVNSTTWEVSKSRTPRRIIAGPRRIEEVACRIVELRPRRRKQNLHLVVASATQAKCAEYPMLRQSHARRCQRGLPHVYHSQCDAGHCSVGTSARYPARRTYSTIARA